MLLNDKNIQLRALETSDLDFLFDIENNTNLWQVSNTLTPFSKDLLKQYLANAHQDIYEAKQLRLVIQSKNNAVGLIDLYDFDPKHKRAGIGIVILEKFQGKGFASSALSILLKYVFNILDLHQVYASITNDNHKSLLLFEKHGFLKVGIKKDWIFYQGEYKDEILYQRFQ